MERMVWWAQERSGRLVLTHDLKIVSESGSMKDLPGGAGGKWNPGSFGSTHFGSRNEALAALLALPDLSEPVRLEAMRLIQTIEEPETEVPRVRKSRRPDVGRFLNKRLSRPPNPKARSKGKSKTRGKKKGVKVI